MVRQWQVDKAKCGGDEGPCGVISRTAVQVSAGFSPHVTLHSSARKLTLSFDFLINLSARGGRGFVLAQLTRMAGKREESKGREEQRIVDFFSPKTYIHAVR